MRHGPMQFWLRRCLGGPGGDNFYGGLKSHIEACLSHHTVVRQTVQAASMFVHVYLGNVSFCLH